MKTASEAPAAEALLPRSRLLMRPGTGTLPVAASFIGSRVLFLLAVWGIPVLTIHTPNILLTHSYPWNRWLQKALFNADSYWFLGIARHGYDHAAFTVSQQHNWGFFPLYPYLTRWVGALPGLNIVWAGYLISSLAFIGFLIVLFGWVKRHAGTEVATLAVVLAAFNPLTPFFVAYRDESLFILLSVLSLEALDRRRWVPALAWGLLGALTRPNGILLAIPYGIAVLLVPDLSRARRMAWLAAGSFFATGFLVMGAVDRHLTGNALAFLEIQKVWNRGPAIPFVALLRWLAHPHFTESQGWALPEAGLVASLVGLFLSGWMLRDRTWWPAAAYLAATVVLANATTSLQGIPRFIFSVPTLYVGAALVATRYRLQTALIVLSVGLLGLYDALWVLAVRAVRT